jgi:hypothetical protein
MSPTVRDVLEASGKLPKAKERIFFLNPPTSCDICQAQRFRVPHSGIKTGGEVFIDGRTRMGPWACMCPPCFEDVGVGLGTGRGQKYQWNEAEQRFFKIEG